MVCHAPALRLGCHQSRCKMKRIYIAANLMDAQLVADMLSTQHIQTHIFNANAIGAVGELATMQMWPEVWVDDDTDAQTAMRLVCELHATPSSESKTCPQCGEENPGNFLSCWNCNQALA